MYNSGASGGKVVGVRHGVHDWSLPLQRWKSQMELTHTGCQLLQRRRRWNLEQIIPELAFNLTPLQAARPDPRPRKGAKSCLFICSSKLVFQVWISRFKEAVSWICLGIMSSRLVTLILKETVSSNAVARFKALLVSYPSREGKEVGGRGCPRKEKSTSDSFSSSHVPVLPPTARRNKFHLLLLLSRLSSSVYRSTQTSCEVSSALNERSCLTFSL